ncbi:hypothetical protein [Bacteroides thetaiotaomicron]|jgi:peptidase M, neutral zinc metallopeptidase, zinc-binding site|uniref:hypothetical protein n=2 Tax=Bacteroides TaxID=816 RepID=UPI0028698550|nr:hypothetical protein [Bacteroides thetaiotaomicron]
MHRHQPGNRQQKEKKAAAGRNRNDFLTGRILPVTPDYCMEIRAGEKINLTTRENFDFLYRSALRYSALVGLRLPFRPTGKSPRMNIVKLYRAMDTILPEHVNLEEENGRLYFCLYRFHEWPEYKLFWIPLEFTERLPEKLGKIALEFIRQLARHHGIPKSTDTSYYEMAHDYLEDYRLYDEEATAGEIRRKAALARLYEKGKAHRILKRMDNPKGFLADLEGEIRKYHTKKNNERALLELLTEGTAYISYGSPSIMQYSYDWAYEEAADFRPVGLDTQIMVTWSVKDAMNDEMESYFNSDYQESYVITPVTTFHLTPDTEKPFSMDDFPERFSHWLERFTKLITNNF